MNWERKSFLMIVGAFLLSATVLKVTASYMTLLYSQVPIWIGAFIPIQYWAYQAREARER